MAYDFYGKIAFVTGSSCGIGKAILFALAKKGCRVILHCLHNNNELKKTINELKLISKKFKIIKADLTKENQVKKIFNQIGSLDILINNVGNYLKKDLRKLTINEWHYIINSNLNSTFYCTYHALPLLRKNKQGRIINIGYASIGQMVSKPKILPYQIAKTGVLLMTKAFAKVEAKNKVTVNMISPGVMENSLHIPKKDIPLKRLGSLKEFANLVVQTIESDYMTGAHIEYAGGFNL